MSVTLAKLSNGGAGLPCCGLASLAVVTTTPLPIIYMHYAARHNKPKQWRGATNYWYIIELMRLYQLDITHIRRCDMQQGRTLVNYLADNPSFYGLIKTDKHIQVCLGSSVYDQGGVKPVSEHWGRNKYVQDIIKINEQNPLALIIGHCY